MNERGRRTNERGRMREGEEGKGDGKVGGENDCSPGFSVSVSLVLTGKGR